MWLIFLLFVLLYWGMVYFDQRSGWFDEHVYTPYVSLAEIQLYQPAAGGSKERGRAVYDNLCALVPQRGWNRQTEPGSAVCEVRLGIGQPNRMIRIPLSGLSGPIQVNGQEWNLSMPAMGVALSDEDLAAVLTYIRQSWGNNAPEITPEQVKAVRAEVGNRTQPWTAAELMSLQ